MVVSSESSTPLPGTDARFLVGSYTADMGGESTGIAMLESRPDGSLAYRGVAAEAASPSYLAATSASVLAVSEATGEVSVFSRHGVSLERDETVAAGGEAPCHLSVVDDVVLVSNYVSGTVGVLAGEPLALVQVVPGDGAGPHDAQDGPHAHATLALQGSADTVIVSADLGADRLHRYVLEGGRLERTTSLALEPGTGPRDLWQHPLGPLLVLGELSAELLIVDASDDSPSVLATVGIPGREPGDHASGISVSADGRFVYVGLRGSNRIAWFDLAADGRSATPAGWVACGGDWPRHHLIEGNFLHVANERSSTVSTFDLGDSGHPQAVGVPEPVPSPTFLLRV